MVKCCLPSLHLQNQAGLLQEVQLVEWSHQKTLGEVWRHGSGHIVVDVLSVLHHCHQALVEVSVDVLLGVPSDFKGSQDGAEGMERLSLLLLCRGDSRGLI